MRLKLICFVIIMLQLITCAACAAPAPVAATTAAEQMDLGQKFLLDMDYDQAIVCFTKAIEIEPRNFEAYMGLGEAHKGKGDTANAIQAYKAAQAFADPANADRATNEIIRIYLQNDQIDRANAEVANLADPSSEPALIAVFRQLDNGKAAESIINIITDNSFIENLEKYRDENGVIHIEDENGFGVGIYPEGCVYIGAYENGIRSGKGTWYYEDGKSYYTGQWENDAPNGEGEIHLNVGDVSMSFIRKCNVKDGIADGLIDETAMIAGETHHWSYNVADGYVGENENATCTSCQIIYAILPGEQVGVRGWTS